MTPSEALRDLRKAIPEQKPIVAQFATAQAALDHKAAHGGWIFVRDDSSRSTWFDAAWFTPSAIMRHPSAHGSGRLI
jgi:hypothetical protein